MSTGAVQGRTAIRLFLVLATRLYRDGLRDALVTDFDVVGTSATVWDSLEEIAATSPDVVLVDGDRPESAEAVAAIAATVPQAKVVALAMPEIEFRLLPLAEAGISGYVSRDASFDDLASVIDCVSRGEMLCSPQMAASLLRRVTTLAGAHEPERTRPELTERQREIVGLIAQGLTNKQIASRLSIELPTVKNHLHTIFARLDVHRRSEAVAFFQEHERARSSAERAHH